MKKEPTFYMALPTTEREKLRERQKLRTYREYAKTLTSLNVNRQMNAESDYLKRENRILFHRITDGDTQFLDITPDNFRVLGKLAKKMQKRYRKDVTVMSFDDLMRGYEFYRKKPPVVKSNQIPLEIEQQIVDIAIENVTWGTPHIMHAMRNIGNFQLKQYHVRCALVKNHIPNADERSKKGLSWKAFVAGMKTEQEGGVFFQ